jgi:hypothetical protein
MPQPPALFVSFVLLFMLSWPLTAVHVGPKDFLGRRDDFGEGDSDVDDDVPVWKKRKARKLDLPADTVVRVCLIFIDAFYCLTIAKIEHSSLNHRNLAHPGRRAVSLHRSALNQVLMAELSSTASTTIGEC